jgi:hypothetical protein
MKVEAEITPSYFSIKLTVICRQTTFLVQARVICVSDETNTKIFTI